MASWARTRGYHLPAVQRARAVHEKEAELRQNLATVGGRQVPPTPNAGGNFLHILILKELPLVWPVPVLRDVGSVTWLVTDHTVTSGVNGGLSCWKKLTAPPTGSVGPGLRKPGVDRGPRLTPPHPRARSRKDLQDHEGLRG